MSEEKPKTSMESINYILKDVYLNQLADQLNRDSLFFGTLPKRPPLTRKQKLVRKWKRFWEHIPDFIAYVKAYEYQDWQWKE